MYFIVACFKELQLQHLNCLNSPIQYILKTLSNDNDVLGLNSYLSSYSYFSSCKYQTTILVPVNIKQLF